MRCEGLRGTPRSKPLWFLLLEGIFRIELLRAVRADAMRKFGLGMLGDVVSIRFTEDEETLYERLEVVFSRVKEELRKAKMAKDATNYLQTLSNLQGATFNI